MKKIFILIIALIFSHTTMNEPTVLDQPKDMPSALRELKSAINDITTKLDAVKTDLSINDKIKNLENEFNNLPESEKTPEKAKELQAKIAILKLSDQLSSIVFDLAEKASKQTLQTTEMLLERQKAENSIPSE